MINIEDTEKLIASMRAQARALETGADALENALAPFKAAQQGMESWNSAMRSFFEFYQVPGNFDFTRKG